VYKLFISLRYLRSRPISYVATGVLMLGVAVLLIVTSVMGGFQREFHKKVRGTLSDESVESRVYFGITDAAGLAAEIRKDPHVVATAPYVENIVLIDTAITRDYGFLKAIDPAQEVTIGDFASYLLSPREILEAELEPQSPAVRELYKDELAAAPSAKPDPRTCFQTKSGLPGILVGVQLYNFMRMRTGDVIKLGTFSNQAREIDPQQLTEKDFLQKQFEVVGAFKTGMYEQDKRTLYCAIDAGQRFLGIDAKPAHGDVPAEPARISGINVKLDDYRRSHEVAQALRARLDDPRMYVLPWDMRNENLIKAVATEQFMIYFIVFFMIILAGLNLTSILTLGVIEKTKDLGILGAVGAPRLGVMQIFLFQGGLIATVGAALGTGFGLLFLRYINEIDQKVIGRLFGRRVFDPSIYYLDRIPTEVSGFTVFLCVVPTILLGFCLAVYPAIRAARLDPIEALRYE
jgi:lipoprotein-releasing system permease protein